MIAEAIAKESVLSLAMALCSRSCSDLLSFRRKAPPLHPCPAQSEDIDNPPFTATTLGYMPLES